MHTIKLQLELELNQLWVLPFKPYDSCKMTAMNTPCSHQTQPLKEAEI